MVVVPQKMPKVLNFSKPESTKFTPLYEESSLYEILLINHQDAIKFKNTNHFCSKLLYIFEKHNCHSDNLEYFSLQNHV